MIQSANNIIIMSIYSLVACVSNEASWSACNPITSLPLAVREALTFSEAAL